MELLDSSLVEVRNEVLLWEMEDASSPCSRVVKSNHVTPVVSVMKWFMDDDKSTVLERAVAQQKNNYLN